MGRTPKPTALHKLEGTLNATRHGKGRAGEPMPDADLEWHAPPWFTKSQQASWAHVIKHAPARLLKELDRGVLSVWCEAEDRWRTAVIQQAKLDAGSPMPLLTKGRDGAIPSPYLRIIRHAADQMLQCARELGFSPAARPRLSIAPGAALAESADPWDALASRGGAPGSASTN